MQKQAIYLLLSLCLTACSVKQKTTEWNKVEIDPTISSNSIYRQLDNQYEIFSALEKRDYSMKRTSDVKYFTGSKVSFHDDEYAKLNNCRAYFFHPDTLLIRIGIGNGFGGHGFMISYRNNKFYTEPYFSTDVIYSNEPEPTYKIVYQTLILDKAQYLVGDSLYGKIEFNSIETNGENKKIEHFGSGYFRTKVDSR